MRIKREVRKFVEEFARQGRPEEIGGYLIKNSRGTITNFLPIPSAAAKPRSAYATPDNGPKMARIYAESLGRTYSYSVEAFIHSHPYPSILSEADITWASSNRNLLFVTVTPTDNGYMWYACRGIVPERIYFV